MTILKPTLLKNLRQQRDLFCVDLRYKYLPLKQMGRLRKNLSWQGLPKDVVKVPTGQYRGSVAD